jgi:selenocysteine lyase/cysteine desulfurase
LFGQRLLGLVDAPGADFNALWQTLLFERKADLVRFRLESTLRASLALYNTCEDLDALVAALWDLRQGRNPGLV